MKKKDQPEKLLTETELELMNILWKLEQGTVADVMSYLGKDRQLAYTSVSTILRILEQKRVLETRKEGRGHTYIPVLSKNDYEAKTIKHVVEKVFDGTPVGMVRQLLNSMDLSAEEIKELRKLISGQSR